MSAVVVGYVPSPEGRAALQTGISEARLRGARLVVVNTTRGDALVDDRYLAGDGLAALQAELEALDLVTELRQQESWDDVADDLDAIADEVAADLIVIGLRRRSARGQADPGERGQPDPPDRAPRGARGQGLAGSRPWPSTPGTAR